MKIINIKFTDINKFNKQQKDELENFLNIEHRHWAKFYNKDLIKKINLDEYINQNIIKNLHFLLYYKENKLVGRIEYHEYNVNDKIIKNFDMIISLIFNFETDWLRYKYKKFKLNKIVKRSILKRISEIDKREKILLNA